MRKRDFRDYLQDIIESIDDIESFTKNISFEKMLTDKKTLNAVIRSLEIMGEAAKRIPKSIKDKNSSIPWQRMAGMRNKLIHEYFGVDNEIVWKTIKDSLPELKEKIVQILEQKL